MTSSKHVAALRASELSDRYVIEGEVGAGGMATVYIAHDRRHDRKVAVKILRPDVAAALGAERFLTEIKVTAKLQHPHILPLHDSGRVRWSAGDRDWESLFYVMPYVVGESLREALKRQGKLPVEQALRVAVEVADALDSAHRQGVVHRDVKPGNILLREGHAFVTDFGIALAAESAAAHRLTGTGIYLGTPTYMSPEQISGDRETDARSDIYSLGCVLFEMLAGGPPFHGPTAQAVITRHLTEQAPPISVARPGLPKSVAKALARALSKTPADRFGSATEFARALLEHQEETAPQGKSIVVLPFENLSSESDQEYFSDGLTEEVIFDLSKIRSLHVISRSSAMTFKGTKKKVTEIAKELNVHYVLEGSVRKSGTQLRITSQLIDAATDRHLWAERFDGELTDVFGVQEEVARAIARALEVELTPAESRRVAQRRSTNVHAYECYLRSRHALHQYSKDGFDRAIRHLQTGISVDPDSALLQAGLGYAYAWGGNAGMMDTLEAYQKAEAHAARALELDREIAQAHLALGMVNCYLHWDLANALGEFETACALDPSDWDTRLQLAFFFVSVGDLSRGLEHARAMIDLDPTNPVGQAMVGYMQMLEGRSEYGLQTIQGAGLDPELPWHVLWVTWALVQVGRRDEALRALEPVDTAPDDDQMASLCLLFRAGMLEDIESFKKVQTPRFLSVAERDPAVSWFMADAHALLGDRDGTLDWLERAVHVGFINYPVLFEVDTLLGCVRGEARFKSLMEDVKSRCEQFGRLMDEQAKPGSV